MGNSLKQQPRQQTTIDLSPNDPQLHYSIETEFGLLDELYSSGVLNHQQTELVQSEGTQTGKVRQLLKEVKKLSNPQQERFLSALDKTCQSHITNYIRNNGQRPTNDTDNWPIIACEEWNRVMRNWSQLINLIDPRNGLLDELLSIRYISDQQKRLVEQVVRDDVRNGELLMISRKKSVGEYKKFIDCLTKTKQYLALSLMEPDQSTILPPIREENMDTLITNHSILVELIELIGSGLTAKLLSADVITRRQKESIESATTPSESNGRLLDIVKRGSELDYRKFIECLHDVGQSHVASVLQSNGIVAEIVAQTSLSTAEEDYVIEQFFGIFRNTSKHRRELLQIEFLKITSATLDENQLIAVTKTNSIKLFILCTSLSGLHYLNELFSTDQLRFVIEQILSVLFNCEQPVTVCNVEWTTSDYNKCVQYLSAVSSLTVHSQLYRLAQQSNCVPASCVRHSLPINKLPHELLELTLLKATGQLFVALKKMVSCAHIITMTTLHGVSLYWWETLTCRQAYRLLLIKFFDQQCAPYRFNPKPVTSICSQQCRWVSGVAELFRKLFIARSRSNKLKVFSIVGSSYNDLGEEILVPELQTPSDLVACRTTNCLFISDVEARCIWRVSSSSSFQDTTTTVVRKFIKTEYEPDSLSVQCGRLYVTSFAGVELNFYSCDAGELVKKIKLPRYMFVQHAVETLNGTVVVCHINRFVDDRNSRRRTVSEVAEDGRVLRVYKGDVMFQEPYYVTMDSKNHVLVCDREKKQILHLNRELEFEHIALKDELRGQPASACYSEERRRLYVSYYSDETVDVYSV